MGSSSGLSSTSRCSSRSTSKITLDTSKNSPTTTGKMSKSSYIQVLKTTQEISGHSLERMEQTIERFHSSITRRSVSSEHPGIASEEMHPGGMVGEGDISEGILPACPLIYLVQLSNLYANQEILICCFLPRLSFVAFGLLLEKPPKIDYCCAGWSMKRFLLNCCWLCMAGNTADIAGRPPEELPEELKPRL